MHPDKISSNSSIRATEIVNSEVFHSNEVNSNLNEIKNDQRGTSSINSSPKSITEPNSGSGIMIEGSGEIIDDLQPANGMGSTEALNEFRTPEESSNNVMTLSEIKRSIHYDGQSQISVGQVHQAVNNQLDILNRFYQHIFSETGSVYTAGTAILNGFQRLFHNFTNILNSNIEVSDTLIILETTELINKKSEQYSHGLELPTSGYKIGRAHV